MLDDARAALLAKQYLEALELYRTAARAEPANPAVFEGMGRALFELHRYEQALAECQKALALDSNLPLPHITAAYIYGRQGNLDASRREALEARRLGPELPEVLLCYGTVLLAEGDLENAVAALERAVELSPQNRNAHYNLSLAWYRKGSIDRYLSEKQAIWRLDRSGRSLLELVLAYGIRHRIAVGSILAGSLILAVVLRKPYLLLLALLEAATVLFSGAILVYWHQWRSGVLMLLYGTGICALAYVIFVMFFR